MAEHWIEAAQALELAGSDDALCERTRSGLVQARARLLLIDDERHEDVRIPSKFWETGGREASGQDWASGDFFAWISTEQWKAFGVSFALSGVLDMLPFERRGLAARSLSVAGNVGWVSAMEARQFAYNEGGVSPTRAGDAVIEQAKLGFITARAVLAQGSKGQSNETDWSWEAREWDIPPWFWQRFADDGNSSQDWSSGLFAGGGKGPNELRFYTLHGVRFLRESLIALLPTGSARLVKTVPKNKGGRPPAAFADDLMCAIWGLIYQGDLERFPIMLDRTRRR